MQVFDIRALHQNCIEYRAYSSDQRANIEDIRTRIYAINLYNRHGLQAAPSGLLILIKSPVSYLNSGMILAIFHLPSILTNLCSIQLLPSLVSTIILLFPLCPETELSSSHRP